MFNIIHQTVRIVYVIFSVYFNRKGKLQSMVTCISDVCMLDIQFCKEILEKKNQRGSPVNKIKMFISAKSVRPSSVDC